MTDRIGTLTVVLDRDIREDDLEQTIAAIMQIRRVAYVKHGEPASPAHLIECVRMRQNVTMKVLDALREHTDPEKA